MSRLALRWGLAAAVAYVAVAVASFGLGLLPVRPLFDGLAPPPPYNYVNPPPDLAADNRPPQPGTSVIELDEEGSLARSVATPDGQAIVILPQGTVAPREGEEAIVVWLHPLDPETVAPPPEDLFFDGNGYRVGVTYQASEEPAELEREITVVLRYPIHAEVMLHHDGTAWERLLTDLAVPSQQLFADAPAGGVFVAASPPQQEGLQPWTPWVVAVLGVLAAAAGYFVGHRSRRSDPSQARDERRRD